MPVSRLKEDNCQTCYIEREETNWETVIAVALLAIAAVLFIMFPYMTVIPGRETVASLILAGQITGVGVAIIIGIAMFATDKIRFVRRYPIQRQRSERIY